MSYVEQPLSGPSSSSKNRRVPYERSQHTTIPAFHHGEDYRWRRAFGDSRQKAIEQGSLATNISVFRRVLPPQGYDYNDVHTCEDFDQFVRDNRRTVIYITLPPKLRGTHVCRDERHTNQSQSCPRALQSSQQARLIRLGESVFDLACASDVDYDQPRMMQNMAFHSFRAKLYELVKTELHYEPTAQSGRQAGWETHSRTSATEPGRSLLTRASPDSKVPSIAVLTGGAAEVTGTSDEHSGAETRPEQAKSSGLNFSRQPSYSDLFGFASSPERDFHDTYRWASIYENMDKVGEPGYVVVGEMVSEKLLPPDPEDLTDHDACAMFDRYIKVTDRERIYATIGPLSNDLRCQHSNKDETCSALLQPGARAVLDRVSPRNYTVKCPRHDSLEDHANLLESQEDDIRLVHKLNQGNTESLFPSVYL